MALMGNYNGSLSGMAGANPNGSIDQDVQMFRRILEALSNEPVDVNCDMDHMMGGTQCRVFFRHSQVYSQVDLQSARYGGNMLEEMARLCIKQKDDYLRNREKQNLQRAYIGQEVMQQQMQGGQSAPPPKRRNPQVDAALNAYKETNHRAVIASPPQENSYNNPLQVSLQKKVDAWLK